MRTGVIASIFFLLGILAGSVIAAHEVVEHDWSHVRVYQGPTLVPNPAALTPEELADATILKPTYRYVYCFETGDVREEEDMFPYPCKDIRHAE